MDSLRKETITKTNRVITQTLLLVVGTLIAFLISCQSGPVPQATQAAPTPAVSSASKTQPDLKGASESTGLPKVKSKSASEQTALPTMVVPNVEDGTLSRLALGMRYNPSIAALDRDGDIAIEAYQRSGRRMDLKVLSSAPKGNRLLMVTSTEGIEEILDDLDVEISYIGYDLERWERTPVWEQEHPVEAVQKLQQIAHSRGLKLLIIPTIPYTERYGQQLALYTDVYVPQAKAYQARLEPAEYRVLMRRWFQDLKQANPKVKLYLDLAASPKGEKETPADLIEHVKAVHDLVDGAVIYYTPESVETVREFVKLMGR